LIPHHIASWPHHFYFFLIFLINASASPLGGARGVTIIHLFGFDQADIAQSQPPKKTSNP